MGRATTNLSVEANDSPVKKAEAWVKRNTEVGQHIGRFEAAFRKILNINQPVTMCNILGIFENEADARAAETQISKAGYKVYSTGGIRLNDQSYRYQVLLLGIPENQGFHKWLQQQGCSLQDSYANLPENKGIAR